MVGVCVLSVVVFGAAMAGTATVAPTPAMLRAAKVAAIDLRKILPWLDVPSRGRYCTAVRGAVNEASMCGPLCRTVSDIWYLTMAQPDEAHNPL